VETPDRSMPRPLGSRAWELRLEGVLVRLRTRPKTGLVAQPPAHSGPWPARRRWGPSGAGQRSTLFSPVCCASTTAQREVGCCSTGQDLAGLRAADLRRAIALVWPQPELRVLWNVCQKAIRFGRPAKQRAGSPGSTGWPMPLTSSKSPPGGLRGPDRGAGSNFPAVQLQRLAIARAVLRQSRPMLCCSMRPPAPSMLNRAGGCTAWSKRWLVATVLGGLPIASPP